MFEYVLQHVDRFRMPYCDQRRVPLRKALFFCHNSD